MAAEGTAAHSLGEYKLRKVLGQNIKRPISDFQNDDMEAYTDDYCSYVMEEFQKVKLAHPDATVLIKQRLDFSKYVPDGFGTGDCIIIFDGLMHIIDFKYGKGVRVKAENNPQMKLYALGSLNNYSMLYEQPEIIKMTIFQPRIENISTWSIETSILLNWANTELKEKAELAINHGKQWDGFKIVEGRSIRKYKDEVKVAEISKDNGFTDIYQQSLLPITKLERVMGKKKFNDLLGQYIYKSTGKLTLVPNSDKRPAVDTTNAQDEFTEV